MGNIGKWGIFGPSRHPIFSPIWPFSPKNRQKFDLKMNFGAYKVG